MISIHNKLIAWCLAWLMLLAPMGNAIAAVSMSALDDIPGMQMSGGQGNCADCQQHSDSTKAKPCCEGASCALMGGCSACAAGFHVMYLPVPVHSPVSRLTVADSVFLSTDPEHLLRPPRA